MIREDRRRTRVTLIVAVVLSLGACQERQRESASGATSVGNSAARTVEMAPNAVSKPETRDTAPAETRSFAALMRRLDARQQARAREWYDRIKAPPMGDATPPEVAWMRARGYPMPSDIARAATMSEAELKAAASSGETTALVIYVARLLEEYERTYDSVQGPLDPARYRDPARIRLVLEVDRIMPQVLASGSPYAGYLYAAKDRLMYPSSVESNAASQLAGLVWASKLGDTRADQLLKDPVVRAVDAATASAAVSLMLHKAMYVNPQFLSMPVIPIPQDR